MGLLGISSILGQRRQGEIEPLGQFMLPGPVAATVPNLAVLEVNVDDAHWRDDLLTHPFVGCDGHLELFRWPR